MYRPEDNKVLDEEEALDEEAEEESRRGVGFYIKLILKAFVISITVLIFTLVIIRSCMQRDTDIAKTMIWTESAVAAYKDHPDSFSVLEIPTHNTYDIDRIFTVSHPLVIEELGQIQFTLRYNTSLENALKESYGTEELPERLFVFILKSQSGETYTEYRAIPDARYMYKYQRVVFENVDLSGQVTLQAFCVLDGDPVPGNQCDELIILREYDASRSFAYKKQLRTTPTEGMESFTVNYLPPHRG